MFIPILALDHAMIAYLLASNQATAENKKKTHAMSC